VDAVVVIFPANVQSWIESGMSPRRARTIGTSTTGEYRVPGLPSGEYAVAALDPETVVDLQDPQFVSAVTRVATRVTLADGDKKTLLADHHPDPVIAMTHPRFISAQFHRVARDRGMRTLWRSTWRQRPPLAQGVATVPGQRPPSRDTNLPPAVGTATIAGAITTSDGDARPVRRALVILNGTELRGTRQAITDDAGRFVFSSLPAGRFTLNASKPGYVTTYYGGTRPGRGPGIPLAVTDGQTIGDLTLKMPWGAVIAGTVTDTNGQPITSLRVQVMEARLVNGERTYSYVSGGIGNPTDDRGSYRLYGLPPGEFVVAASSLSSIAARLTTADEIRWAQQQSPGPNRVGAAAPDATSGPPLGQPVTYAPVYYPGTPDAAASAPVTVRSGEERTGVDFSIPFVPTSKVEGVITRSDSQPVQGTIVMMYSNSRVVSPLFLESGLGNRAVVGADGSSCSDRCAPASTLTARASSRPPGPPAPGARPAPPVMDLGTGWTSR
jgi:protocatechuate 3,4-dioxygenase beta subunit